MKKLYPEEAVQDIADAIRAKNGLSTLYRIGEMASAIEEIPTGGGDDNYLIAIGASVGSIYDTKVTSVMSYQFYLHQNITGVEMTSVSVINHGAFDDCHNLTTAKFPECITINDIAFVATDVLSSISFPKCETIGSQAFYRASALTSVEFPKCTLLNNQAIQACSSLQTISLPLCSVIGASAFQQDIVLQEINLPACNYIMSYAFSNCTRMSKVILPTCSKLSGANIFIRCYSLSQLYLLSSSVCSLTNTNAFQNTPMSVSSYLGYYGSIYVPSSLVDAYKSATNWSYYSDRITAYVE